MTEAAALKLNPSILSIPPDNDNTLGFFLNDWKDFPDIDIAPEHLTETQNDRVNPTKRHNPYCLASVCNPRAQHCVFSHLRGPLEQL
jgi:hypothetical protein